MSLQTLAPCPVCAANAWEEQGCWAWDRWVCTACQTRCAQDQGVMVQAPSGEMPLGEADPSAREALGSCVRDEATWAEDNRRMCALLHRGGDR